MLKKLITVFTALVTKKIHLYFKLTKPYQSSSSQMTHQNPTKGVDCFFPSIKKYFDAFSLSITMPASPKFLFLPSEYHGNSSEQKVLLQKLAYFLMGTFGSKYIVFLIEVTPCVFRIARYPLHRPKYPQLRTGPQQTLVNHLLISHLCSNVSFC